MANWKILVAVLGLISACAGQGSPPGPDPCEREDDFAQLPNPMSCTVSSYLTRNLYANLNITQPENFPGLSPML